MSEKRPKTRSKIPESPRTDGRYVRFRLSSQTRTHRSLFIILGIALAWGLVVAQVGLFAGMIVFCKYLWSSYNLCGLAPIFLAPGVFIAVTWLALIWQVRRALTLPRWALRTYAAIVILWTLPLVGMWFVFPLNLVVELI